MESFRKMNRRFRVSSAAARLRSALESTGVLTIVNVLREESVPAASVGAFVSSTDTATTTTAPDMSLASCFPVIAMFLSLVKSLA
jgi:hypothetical protein